MRLALASIDDYRRCAEKKLPRMLFDYVDGGAGRETTLTANVADLRAIRLNQSVMRDVSNVQTSTTLFGEEAAMPLALAPIGMAGMMARRAEVQAVRAAEAAGVPFCLSTLSICSLEEVAAAATKPFWFQLYMMKDRGCVRELLQRAQSVNCKTLVFTVDLAAVGTRYRDTRNGMDGGVGVLGRIRSQFEYFRRLSWLWTVGVNGKPHTFGNLASYVPNADTPAKFKEWIDAQLDATVTWKDIDWLRRAWPGRLVIKGILSSDDARAASDCGADGVIASNHGGRQLDGVSSSIRVTPRIVDAVGDTLEVLMDGGVRNGQDLVKARASGAKVALIGRPWIWALAVRGEAGLRAMLAAFKSELEVTMALTGACNIEALTGDVLNPHQTCKTGLDR